MFNPGDVVVLKGGGPEMVIERIDAAMCSCVWFDDKYQVVRDIFRLTSVEIPMDDGTNFVTNFTA